MESELKGRHPSRDETEFYKGVGILLIVLHNFFHWVRPSPGENEFGFSRESTIRLLEGLRLQPLEAVNLLLDYFGHYGVQVFVFLSAYGLARAYSSGNIRWTAFMLRRAGRIYPAFLLAVLAHLLFVITPWNEHLAWFLKVYLLKLSGLSAFFPGMQFSTVGPWWFFSFILQFYAVFPLLNMLSVRNGAHVLFIVSLIGLALTTVGNTYLIRHGINLYATVLGHLPVLCLGIYFARAAALEITPRIAVIAAVAFLLGLWFYAAWLVAPICVTLLFLFLMPRFAAFLPRWPLALRFVSYCGKVSLPLFAIHGMMRLPFTQLANAKAQWHMTLLLSVAFLVAALAAAQFMHSIEVAGQRWLARARGAAS